MAGLQMETISLVMDGILITIAVWMALTARKISLGGAVGKTVSHVVWGAVILGLAHAIETILTDFFHVPHKLNEFVHRSIILVGFLMLGWGIKGLAESIIAARKAAAKS